MITIQTSKGPIELSEAENALLEKLLAGSASLDESQQLYQSTLVRGLPFPLEWEIHVLRTSVAKLPDREDLIQRLAVVEAELSRKSISFNSENERLAWERAWVNFSNASLIGIASPEAIANAHACVFSCASVILSNPCFVKLPITRRVNTIVALHNTLMSSPSHDNVLIADLGIRQFHWMLDDPDITTAQVLQTFDALHSLYFSGVNDVLELRRFDAITPVLEKWLTRHAKVGNNNVDSLEPARNLNIAYLLHTAHYDRGNAVSPLIVSLADAHAKTPNRRVFLYLVQYSRPEFVNEVSDLAFMVRSFPQDSNYDRIDEIADSLLRDKIDVIVTEQNRAIATALFVRRVAPLQMWIDTGFPFWSLRALDWTLSPTMSGKINPLKRKSRVTWRQHEHTLRKPVNQEEVARARSFFPEDAFVIGVFVRLSKLTRHFLEILCELLATEPKFRMVIAGTGNPEMVLWFMAQPSNAGRVEFLNENVNLNIYARVVDVMCDTFPFIGGNACREVAAHGTPVVSMLGTPWDAVLLEDRSPDLLANDVQGYIERVKRLYQSREFYDRQQQIALAIFSKQIDPRRMIDDVETALTAALSENARRDP